MKILALDTALGACSVAVLDGEHILAHRWQEMERGHAEALAPMVKEVMYASELSFPEIGRLAVTTGPGTFTGQRVGLAFARGLRVALKTPLVGATTLEVIAAAAAFETGMTLIAVAHDARRGEVYLEIIAGTHSVFAPAVLAPEVAADAIAKHVQGRTLAVAGTAATAIIAILKTHGIAARHSAARQPDAVWLARLARVRDADDSVPTPLYLRAPDAKLPAGA